MTAIASVYTPEGFIFGSDGLRLDGGSGQTLTEDALKIFPISHPDFMGAYGWAGVTSFVFPTTGVFDLLEKTELIAKKLQGKSFANAEKYVSDLVTSLYEKMANQEGYKPANLMNPSSVVKGLFVGYWRGDIPTAICVEFDHKGGVLQKPKIDFPPIENFIGFGSPTALNQLLAESYRPETLEEGVEQIQQYISRCSALRGKNPECSGIGGKIRIATITPRGFTWAV